MTVCLSCRNNADIVTAQYVNHHHHGLTGKADHSPSGLTIIFAIIQTLNAIGVEKNL